MQDKLLIAIKVKKTIEYITIITSNYPHTEYILKNKIIESCYDLLELVYRANVHKNSDYMKEIIVKVRMIEYYIKISLNKKIISFKKYENIGNHLLEINKMVWSWIKSEKKE